MDNWYFSNPINQRGQTEYIGEIYGIDRWVGSFTGFGTLTVLNDCIKMLRLDNPMSSYAHLYQHIGNLKEYIGKTLTYSMLAKVDSGGIMGLQILTMDSEGNVNKLNGDTNSDSLEYTLLTCTVTIPDNINDLMVGMVSRSPNAAYVKAVKLELSDRQTLAKKDLNGNWVLNDPPPNPATELLKCQRYYQLRSTGDIKAIDLRPTMYKTPTVTQIDSETYAYSAEL